MKTRWSEVFLAVALLVLAAALFALRQPTETVEAASSDFTVFWSSDLLTATAVSQRVSVTGGKGGSISFTNPAASTATVYIRLGATGFAPPNASAVDLDHIVLAPGESVELGGHKLPSFAYIRDAGAATLRYYLQRLP